MNTCIHSYMNWFLTKFVLGLSIVARSNKSLSFTGEQIHASLHFQQTLSIEVWAPSCLWVRIKALTGLGYTMTSSNSRGSNKTFNDYICNKTKDLFIHKRSNFLYEGWWNIIVRSLILNIFIKIMNQVWHKVRCVYTMYGLNSVLKSEYANSFLHESISYQVCFETFNSNKIQQITVHCR